jgi:hypothetical protein
MEMWKEEGRAIDDPALSFENLIWISQITE